MLVRAPLTVLLALLLPDVAAAEPAVFGTAEISASGGYDSNMFLQVSPDAAMREPQVAGPYGRVSPRMGTGLSVGSWRFDLNYDLDYRASDAAGSLILQQLDLSIALPKLGRVRPTLLGSAGLFNASRFPDDEFWFAGGGLELRLELSASFRVTGSYRLELRTFPQRADERDVVHLGEVRFAYRPSPTLEVGVGTAYLAVAPAHAAVMDDGSIQIMRLGPDTDLVWGRLSLGLSAWGGTIQLAGVGRDWEVGGGMGALVRLSRYLDVSASVDLTAAPWADPVRAQDYTRRYFGLGLVAHGTSRHALGGKPPPERLRPVVTKGQVRFRLRSDQAAEVSVVGSWDDWATPGQTLAHTRADGLWEGWIHVPPGTHRYRFLVDGRTVRPPDAPRYMKDDFGDEDAVLDVPQEQP